MTQAVQLAQYGANNVGLSFKNRIINGDMGIDQRNAGASVTPNNSYTLDRWEGINTQTSKYSVQQNAGSVTPPVGFTNYLGVTSLSAYTVGAAELFALQQKIEGFNFADLNWGTANASTVTLSFWVRSSLTGTFGGSLANSAINRSYPFAYTISAANTWEQKSITVAGDTTGTWVGATNGIGCRLYFSLGSGSTYSGTAGSWSANAFTSATGATSVVGTNGATFYITGVQLEVGVTATGFDYRPYGTEFLLCQRYYVEVARGTLGANIGGGYWFNGSQVNGQITFPVTMRTAPTLNSTSGTSYYGIDYNNGSYGSITGWTIYRPTPYSAMIYCGGLSGVTGYSGELFNNNIASMIAFSAEL
jgi:hypothetical protein